MRRARRISPIDPTPDALSLDQLVAEGVVKRTAAAKFLGIGVRELDRRRGEIPSWKHGRARVFPLVGLKAYLAAQARSQGVGI